MHRLLSLLLLLTTFACSQVKQAQIRQPLPSAIPTLHITTDTGSFDLKMAKLAVDVRVVGNMATTTFDITFYNGTDKVLEGEFDFPLADGQTISRYALEVNDKLREGVVVEKAKARVAYEATVRKGIDPGLVEKTAGNNFRTRIYPIPAKGRKRVVIGIEQKLAFANENLVYGLPLQAKEAIDEFSIEASVLHTENPKNEGDVFDGFAFHRTEIGYEGDWHKAGFTANHLFAFSIPFDEEEPTVYTETREGKTYFYAAGTIKAEAKAKPAPTVIGLLWDVSASAQKRAVDKELSLLKTYLAKLGSVKLLLIPFHISPQPVHEFSIAGGDASMLVAKLKSFAYDGGTQLGALNLSAYAADEFLLFSDGLSTFGRKEMAFSGKAVTTISSSPSADYSYLKAIAQQTGASFIDLSKQEGDKAAEGLFHPPLRFLGSKVSKGSIESLVTEVDEADNSFSVSGILNSGDAIVELSFGYGQESAVSKTITVQKNESGTEGVARLWASMQVNKLNLQYEKNKEQITALGKEFSVVTQATSLLVLDRVEDYAEHEVVPPIELQKEYFALLKERQDRKRDAKDGAMEDAVQTMNTLKAWWNTNYAGRKKKIFTPALQPVLVDSGSGLMRADSATTYHFSTANADASKQMEVSLSATVPPPPPPPASPEGRRNYQRGYVNQEALSEVVVTDEKGINDNVSSAIEIAEWKPNASYLKALDKVSIQTAFVTYLTIKKEYATQPSFYFDVAKWFFDNGQKETALQILSNVAELKLENPELLRMMAYQLLDMEQKALAVETFRQILDLREEEPQAYRDLALALNEDGKYAEAVATLYKVITNVWNDRFNGVTAISLNEMNAIISAHKADINTSAIDSRLIYPMPVDVRITIDWNTDNSDIDLWVTDPKAEKCYYQNTETSTGGHISDDMTQGYGPEEFAVKKATSGEYIIEANLYGDTRQTIGGPITIRADLYTDFGKPTQAHKRINFRVTDAKEVVKIGTLSFGRTL